MMVILITYDTEMKWIKMTFYNTYVSKQMYNVYVVLVWYSTLILRGYEFQQKHQSKSTLQNKT